MEVFCLDLRMTSHLYYFLSLNRNLARPSLALDLWGRPGLDRVSLSGSIALADPEADGCAGISASASDSISDSFSLSLLSVD